MVGIGSHSSPRLGSLWVWTRHEGSCFINQEGRGETLAAPHLLLISESPVCVDGELCPIALEGWSTHCSLCFPQTRIVRISGERVV